ncbi:MAG TPA: YdcF family protein [Isosphaeraceae bacterium]|nr:YdcF family protein [Isosphaeraceae bacterium]
MSGLWLDPYRLLFLLLGAGIAILWRRRRVPAGRLLPATLAFAGLAVLSTPALAYLSLGTLEWRYPPTESRPDDAQAIVVLGAGMVPPDGTRLHAELNADSLFRCLHAAAVYHRGKPCPVVVCGGRIAPGPSTPPLAQLMREFLRDQAVRGEDLLVEDQSRTTHENARACRKLLQERRITKVVLVTEATHMFRALRCFRKQGIAAVPSACHHRATAFEWSLGDFLPSAGAVQNHERTFHEWLGSAWYWMRGYL